MANQATAARSKIGKPGATRKVAGGLALFIILLVVVAVIRSGALSTKSGSEAHHETGGLSSSEPTHNNVVVTETAPAPGNGHMPSAQAGGYGAPIAIPLGWQLRTIADNGSGSYRWQFHLRAPVPTSGSMRPTPGRIRRIKSGTKAMVRSRTSPITSCANNKSC